MKITKEEVKRVATLARLELSPEEEDLLTHQLDKIFQYMEKLDQLDTTTVEPLTQVGEDHQRIPRGPCRQPARNRFAPLQRARKGTKLH